MKTEENAPLLTQDADALKKIVREKYGEIAEQSKEFNQSTCCGATGCCADDFVVMAEDYTGLAGYAAEADLGLG